MKQALCSEPIYLAHADFKKGFKIHTDASYFAIAGILTQEGRLVACTSKKLKPYQLAYPIREKELLAVVHSLETFRYYIENNPDIVIFTDHQSLLNITTMPQKDRIYRWILTLLEFSFKIEYIEGGKNIVADCMSRLQDELLVFDPALRINARINAVVTRSNNNAERNNRHIGPIDIDMDFLSTLLQQRLHLPKDMFTLIDSQQLYSEVDVAKRMSLEQFIQLKECHKDVTSLSERQYWIGLIHNLCHYGVETTIAMLKKYVTWSTLRQDVTQYIGECGTCAIHRRLRANPSNASINVPDIGGFRFDCVQIDVKELPQYFDSQGNSVKKVLTMICIFSGWLEVTTMLEEGAEYVASLFYENWVCRYGCPNMIKSDNGTNLLAIHYFVKEACNKNIRTSSPYNAASHGVVERVQQTFADQVIMQMDRLASHNWTHILPDVVAAIRFTSTGTRGVSPFEIVFGSKPSLGLQCTVAEDVEEWCNIITNEHVNQVTRKIKTAITRFAKKTTKQLFECGDIVRVMNYQIKGSRTWSGPFIVIGLHRGNVFLSSGFYYASNQLIKVNVTPKTKQQCQELVDKMLNTGQTHYVDEFTGEIMPSTSYNGDDNVEDVVHQYDFASLFRNAKPFE